MTKWLASLKREMINAIPAIIFFVIAFNLIAYTQDLMLHQYHFHPPSILTVTIGALIVGKIIIIVNSLSQFNLFANKPLVYNIVWKIFIYTIAVFLGRILEAFTHHYFSSKNFSQSLQHVNFILSNRIFWAIQLWLIMLFFVYVVASEFTRILGRKNVMQMLIGKE